MSSKKRTRRNFTPAEKAAAVRRHLIDKQPVSDLCDELAIQPSMFYSWQKLAVENMESAIERSSGRRARHPAEKRATELEAKVAALEARLAKKESVIAELSEEYVTLKKKATGET